MVEGQPVSWPLDVALPEDQPAHDVLAKVWARKKIEDLMQQTYYQGSPAVEEAVTALALDYRLMSQYTSFVAVDEKDADKIASERLAQPPRRMLVPVPLPEGTRWEGFFGPLGEGKNEEEQLALAKTPCSRTPDRGQAATAAGWGGMGGMGGGGFGGGGLGGPMPARSAAAPGRQPVSRDALARTGAAAASPMKPLSHAAGEMKKQKSAEMGYGSRGLRAELAERRQAFATPAVGDKVARLGRSDGPYTVHSEAYEAEFADRDFTADALAADTQPLVQAAQQLLEAGRKDLEKGDRNEARFDLVRAYFLASAAANVGNSEGGQIADQALAELESLHAKLVEAWQKEIPGLGAKLDLVLRDVSVGQALEAIAEAAQLKIRLIDGSLADTAEMLAGRDPRITYLDLRGATAARALDWLLQPLRLAWQPEPNRSDGAILAGSDRRMPRSSAWVYDVSTIALPAQKDLESAGDWNKSVAKAKQAAEQFIGVMRKALRASDREVTWFAPGQLLVIGSPRTQAAAAEAIAQLSDPKASPAGPLAALHAVTSKRAQQRREQVEKLAHWKQLLGVAAAHDEFDWQLLSAALGGELDLEALTELQVAWKDEATQQLLDGKGAAIALRSAWAVTAAAKLLPGEQELAQLAAMLRDRCRPAAEKAVKAVSSQPEDLSAILAAAYAALAMDDADLRASALAALPGTAKPGSPASLALVAARSLLCRPEQIEGRQLLDFIAAGGVSGDDITVLVALACHRAGGDTWPAFRAQMQDLLGEQPLPGSVVVLVNRLPGTSL